MASGDGFYRDSAGTTGSHLSGAQAAQARVYQSEFATMFPVWYRGGGATHPLTGHGRGRKAKKPKRARHATPMAPGSTRDPFKRVGVRQG